MRRRDIETELLDESREARCLAFGQVEHEPGQRARVDDRVRKRRLQAAADKPGVERVVAVLDQHGAVREAEEPATRVLELRRADEHRPVDVVTPARVRVDGSAAVDERVKERKRTIQLKALGADLQNEKWRVARGLNVKRDELSVVEAGLAANLRRVDGDLFPGHELRCAPRLQIERFGAHRASARARRAQAISSPLSARSKSTAAA